MISLLSLLFPSRCAGCGSFGQSICPSCRSRFPFRKPYETACPVCGKPAVSGLTHPRCSGKGRPDGLTMVYRYTGVVRTVLKDVKFRYARTRLAILLDAIPPTSHNILEKVIGGKRFVIIPIPLSRARLSDRGFNQSDIIAEALSVRFGARVRRDLLVRRGWSVPQSALPGKSDRVGNVRGVFKVKKGVMMPQHIILVDDIHTTGATLREATRVLKQSGAAFVWCYCLAG